MNSLLFGSKSKPKASFLFTGIRCKGKCGKWTNISSGYCRGCLVVKFQRKKRRKKK